MPRGTFTKTPSGCSEFRYAALAFQPALASGPLLLQKIPPSLLISPTRNRKRRIEANLLSLATSTLPLNKLPRGTRILVGVILEEDELLDRARGGTDERAEPPKILHLSFLAGCQNFEGGFF